MLDCVYASHRPSSPSDSSSPTSDEWRTAMTADDRATEPAQVWALLLALARRASQGRPVVGEVGLRLDEGGRIEEDGPDPWVVAQPKSRRGWAAESAIGREAELLLD